MIFSADLLGKIVFFHRKRSGLSRNQLALLAGVGKTVVYDLEHGKISIQLDNIKKILDVLNISIHFNSPLMGECEKAVNEKKAKIFINAKFAGILTEIEKGKLYQFTYEKTYHEEPVSLTMPIEKKTFTFDAFPPFFDGLLPEGVQLEVLLKIGKIDANDLFQQLITVGHDLVGNVTVEELK